MRWLAQLLGRKSPQASLWSGTVLTAADFNAQVGNLWPAADESYAVLRAAALRDHYLWFRGEIVKLGINTGEPAFDCDNFAHLFRDFTNIKFYTSQWKGDCPKAQSAAVAAYWFRFYRDRYFGAALPPNSAHAINVVVTDEGVKWIEPQTGEIITLNENEIASRFNIIT